MQFLTFSIYDFSVTCTVSMNQDFLITCIIYVTIELRFFGHKYRASEKSQILKYYIRVSELLPEVNTVHEGPQTLKIKLMTRIQNFYFNRDKILKDPYYLSSPYDVNTFLFVLLSMLGKYVFLQRL